MSSRNEERYNALMKYANDVICILNVDGTLREVSLSATRVFGWDISELIGRNLLEFIHPDDVPLLRRRMEEMLAKPGLTPTVRARLLCKDGSYKKIEGVGNNLLDMEDIRGCVITSRDITDQERNEEQLRILSSAMEQSPVEILILDQQGCIEYVNPAFVASSGYSFEEVAGRNPGFLLAEGSSSQLNREIEMALQSKGCWKGELVNRKKNGDLHWVSVSISCVRNADGEISHYISIAEDITQRKDGELLIRESEALKHAVLQSIPVHLCVLDRTGVVISVNDAWTKFAEMNGLDLIGFGLGANYLEECRRAAERGVPEAETVRSKICQILDGKLNDFSMEYDCHSPDEKRWFTLYAAPLTEDLRGVVIAHVNITARKLEEERLAEALRETDQAKMEMEEVNRQLKNALIKSRKLAIEAEVSNLEKSVLLASIPSILISVNSSDRIIQWNTAAERHFGIPAGRVLGNEFRTLPISWNWEKVSEAMERCRANGETVRMDEVAYRNKRNDPCFLCVTINPFQRDMNGNSGLLLLAEDITERKILLSQLNQSQRLESIGQLAAGIAHEINTPTQYIGDNIRFLQDAFSNVLTVLKQYDDLIGDGGMECLKGEEVARIRELRRKLDIDYLISETPAAISEALEGVGRVTKIVQAMKEFSHPHEMEKVAYDMNKAIESTVTVARNEWKYIADIDLRLDRSLPPVPCLPGEINQVLLNLIVNATHAIGDVVGDGGTTKGKITISTKNMGEYAEIRVCDTGTGIPEEIRDRVFDPFFTTKEVGKGSGQGLSIAHMIITEKHQGRIFFETEMGVGTTFIIQLPLQDA